MTPHFSFTHVTMAFVHTHLNESMNKPTAGRGPIGSVSSINTVFDSLSCVGILIIGFYEPTIAVLVAAPLPHGRSESYVEGDVKTIGTIV